VPERPERIVLREETMEGAAARAAAALRDGFVALLPAEGLYGYHALASSAAGVARLHAVKPRGEGKGWIGLVARPADAYRWIAALPGSAASLIHAHWPGPLTLVLAAGPAVPPSLVGPEGTVALRCPGSPFLRAVTLAAGGLVISTSANAPGEPPAARSGHAELPAEVTLAVDAGPLSGLPSTVVGFEGDRPVVLREGAVRLWDHPEAGRSG
jgi:L-threonylcarbamoyladenylate synthase